MSRVRVFGALSVVCLAGCVLAVVSPEVLGHAMVVSGVKPD